jgi:short-subunit dehydrogenase
MSNDQRPTALITGASGGIGEEFARLFAASGHDLVLVARSAGKLEALARALAEEHGIAARVIAADLSDPAAPAKIARELDGVAIDVLVNNAGYGLYGEFTETELKEELDMIQLNLVALTHLTKLFLPGMVARKSGRILNVASTAAFQPGPLMTVYYATKAYVLSFSEGIAEELRGSGVTLTALCPGPTKTGFQAGAKMEASKLVRGKDIMGSAEVAKIGYAALMKGKRVVIPGAKNRFLAQSVRFLPRSTVVKAVKKAQERASH